ncbi:MAG: hypothetical protein ABS28_04530 [Cryomorphaceae bacterium BACL22 MAG-120619-bin32]|nr:MAG: hypothetical protein ABS28_04530 [Cryomorphaceae bacterium BACL22 MAG-120619-bin32]
MKRYPLVDNEKLFFENANFLKLIFILLILLEIGYYFLYRYDCAVFHQNVSIYNTVISNYYLYSHKVYSY